MILITAICANSVLQISDQLESIAQRTTGGKFQDSEVSVQDLHKAKRMNNISCFILIIEEE